jgi:hypothetical protein
MTKYEFPGYDGSLICDAEYENGDVDNFIMRAKKVMDPK